MSDRRFLCLGGGDGWHADQLRSAAAKRGCDFEVAAYETLTARIGDKVHASCIAGPVHGFDAVLTRTMPAGSLEQITFRLAILHDLVQSPESPAIVNPPRSLEIAIDKFATLAHVARLGYSVPETIVVQSRGEAVDAFEKLGRDCVVKPIFGGEGRGVMRIRDAELAWYTFSTLEQLGAVCYVQRFVRPGGSDTRLLVIGESVVGLRRCNGTDFRTNISNGGTCQPITVSDEASEMAIRICDSMGLKFAAVDIVDSNDGIPKIIEVNAIPGWKGAQSAADFNIAERIIELLVREASSRKAHC